MAKSVELARGEYVWLFSADDWMAEGALKRVLMEARHIRRGLKNEYFLRDLWYIIAKTSESHISGDIEYLDGLVAKLYLDGQTADRLRLLLFRMAPSVVLRLVEKVSGFWRKFFLSRGCS